MNKKKIIKICLIVLALILVLALVYMIRNYIIAKNIIEKNVAKALQSESIHTKTIIKEGDNVREIFDNYKKDDKELTINVMHSEGNDIETTIATYVHGTNKNTYYDNKSGKFVQQETVESVPEITEEQLYADLENENNLTTFLSSAFTTFKVVEYNGKDCYLIKGFMSSTALTSEDADIYIDKETGLFVKTNASGIDNEREYEFDNVDDSIFEEPDISQYTIKK